MIISPESAMSFYSQLVEQFPAAVPMMLLVGDSLNSMLLDLPDDSPEIVAPEMIRMVHGLLDTGPLEQALLSVEAETMSVDRPFAGTFTAVCIYSGGVDEFRLVYPFRRTGGTVTWNHDRAEVAVGPSVLRDPIIGALRWVVEQSR